MTLASHFTLVEVMRSGTAAERGIDNSVPLPLRYNIGRITEFMECVRWVLGDAPIIVTSWYRCQALNSAIGGSKTSAHMKGLAMDFKHSVLSLESVFDEIRQFGLPFDQLIIEGTRGKAEWLHLGLSEDEPRGDVLLADRDQASASMAYTRVMEG